MTASSLQVPRGWELVPQQPPTPPLTSCPPPPYVCRSQRQQLLMVNCHNPICNFPCPLLPATLTWNPLNKAELRRNIASLITETGPGVQDWFFWRSVGKASDGGEGLPEECRGPCGAAACCLRGILSLEICKGFLQYKRNFV